MNIMNGLKIILLVMAATTFARAESDTQEGKKIYQKHCAICHGVKLEGGIGSSLIDHVWNYGSEPQFMGMNIKYGIPNLAMPAWKDVLSDDEIKSVIGFILEQDKNSTLAPPPILKQVTTEIYDLNLEVLDSSLVEPWSIAFINKDEALVTDKIGKLYRMVNGKIQKEPIRDIPDDITNVGQSGLMDVVLDPDYASNGWIYLSYSHELAKAKGAKRADAMTRIIRGRIKDARWTDQQILFEADHELYSKTRHHYGSRITFDDKGYLYFSVGDRGAKEQAQDISWPNGKIHRIHKDGSIPKDNPYLDQPGAIPSIFSYGHRNPQGMSLHPETKEIWVTEHGPMGGDELNHIRAGKNFGWPEITHGINYDGKIISEFTEKDGMEQPVHYWTPSIAVCDIDFYVGDMFPEWKNNLLVTSLKYRDLRRLVIEGDKVIHEEILLKGIGRMRSVTVGPDGAIYILVNDPSLILRLTPKVEISKNTNGN